MATHENSTYVWTVYQRAQDFENLQGIYESLGDALASAHLIYAEEGYADQYGPIEWQVSRISREISAYPDSETYFIISRFTVTPKATF
jgi:hypothetical protein